VSGDEVTESHVWPADKLAAAAEFARRIFGEHVDITRPGQQLITGGRRNGRATFRRLYLDALNSGAEAVDAGERTPPPPLVYHLTANVEPLERAVRSTGELLSRMFIAGTHGFDNRRPLVPAEWFRPPPAVVPLCLAGPRHESRCAGGTDQGD
jgi:hypothetical protein